MQVYNEIIKRLQPLEPQHVALENESMNHAGYFEGKESHFKLTVVSDSFTAKRLVARHQTIYALMDSLMTSAGGNIHALAIHAYTPIEWQNLTLTSGTVPASPLCAGQNKSPSH